jgi:hypothetical protein
MLREIFYRPASPLMVFSGKQVLIFLMLGFDGM